MSQYGRFFLPGPTEVRPEVLQAMTGRMIGHRGAQMTAILERIDPRLRAMFRTTRPVYVATASATLFMEAAVRNGVRQRALCLVNGAFSGRFRDLVADCAREFVTYEVAWGDANEPGEVERILLQGGFDAVTVVHSETSTGVLNPLAEIAEAVRSAERRTGEEILVLVDGVTSVGGMLVEAEAWGLDFLLTGSQKALALPPGLALGAASTRLLDRAATLPGRGQYLDLLEYETFIQRHQTPTTPALSLIYALDEQLASIAGSGGIEARAARHWAMAERCWGWTAEALGDRGYAVLAPAGRRSPTVTAIRLPDGASSAPIVAALKERGYTIGSGYGRLKETTIRIGHRGDHSPDGLTRLLDELHLILHR
jgi:predicted phosphoserine aminotransferase